MALGNYTPFRAKDVTAFKFGATAFTTSDMTSTTVAMDNAFNTNNSSGDTLLDLVGSADTVNPTKSYAFAKDFTESGNERTSSQEALLGADSAGSQNTELTYGDNSKIDVEATVVYRNTEVTKIFNDTTTCCIISMDNNESSGTGELNIVYNNIKVMHVGSLTRNSDGLFEQKIKFSCRGGFAGTVVSVSQSSPTTETWRKFPIGPDMVQEIRLT